MWWLWMPLAVFCYLLVAGMIVSWIKMGFDVPLSKGEMAYVIFWLPATAGVLLYVILAFPVILGVELGERIVGKD